MSSRTPLALLATALACSLFAAPAQALRARVFVSKTGADVGGCSFSAPCQSLIFAYNAVLPGGEITMLDSAGYEPLTINKALTITGPAGVEAGIAVPSGGTAITISAGPTDAVVLRGLTLTGGGVGYNGIVFNSGGSLTIDNCIVRNFAYDGSTATTGNGVLIVPNSATMILVVTNTTVSDNGNVGLYYLPQSGASIVPTRATIDHVVATNNQYGIVIDASHLGISNITDAISSSVANNNRSTGIAIGSGSQASVRVSIDGTEASNNSLYGITAGGSGAEVLLGRSVITNNSFNGIINDTLPPNTFYSYGNNQINLNGGGDIGGGTPALNTTFTLR